MIDIKKIFIGLLFFIVAQSLSWFQNNAQFLNSWIKDHPIIFAGILGLPIGYCYINGTANLVAAFEGSLWPPRLLGFATGIFSFTVLTYLFFKEGVNIKTATTLILASVIVLLQIFWKYD